MARRTNDYSELAGRESPAGAEALLELYWQLRQQAGSNGISANAITFGEVHSWQQIYGVRLTPQELDLIFAMDAAAITAFAENKS